MGADTIVLSLQFLRETIHGCGPEAGLPFEDVSRRMGEVVKFVLERDRRSASLECGVPRLGNLLIRLWMSHDRAPRAAYGSQRVGVHLELRVGFAPRGLTLKPAASQGRALDPTRLCSARYETRFGRADPEPQGSHLPSA